MISRLRNAVRSFMGKPVIDEKDIKALMKELQRTLLSSDVDVSLALKLTKSIEEKLRSETAKGFTLKQRVITLLYDELSAMFGESYSPKLTKHRIMLIGLYGSGKTTTAGKLAHYYSKKGLSVAVASLDTERPAGQEQLRQLVEKLNATYYPYDKAVAAIGAFKEDIFIVDTAGKNALDDELLNLLEEQYNIIKPDEVFLVIPADIGKVAAKQVESFNKASPITAAIVTRFEGSGKAGGVLSALAKHSIPIAFLGTGEKIEALETFDAKSFVSKLLGLPDIKGLIEKAKEANIEESDELNLETFYKQLKAAKDMGPLSQVMGMAGMYDVPKELLIQGEEKMQKYEAIINSMTPYERKNPEVFKKERSRIDRVARGAGVPSQEVNRLLSEFFKMEKLVKKLKNDRGVLKKLKKMMPGLKL
ncbi:MAG: signal recognition particle protein Srp19 [Methanobacteriota archaeon]|nr:MAG: signal recognition particle protein Srp19 [Euryarchaeota archaeon]